MNAPFPTITATTSSDGTTTVITDGLPVKDDGWAIVRAEGRVYVMARTESAAARGHAYLETAR
jgi:hypothetical protein